MPHSTVETHLDRAEVSETNLIADTSACPSTTSISRTSKRLFCDGGQLPFPTTISDDPLDKIFGDIPVRSEDLIHVSVTCYKRPWNQIFGLR
jgi:hypothetical protein